MPARSQATARHAVITTPSGPLHGTLRTPPAPPVAAALLLPGSGPVDRDSDHRKLPLGVTRLLAEGLADAGVLTLRYDKRGVGESAGDFWSTGMLQNVEDAVEALRVLRAATASAPLFLVGHSEGALLATAVAAREPVDGLVLLSCPARSGRETLAWQAEALQSDLPAVGRLVLTLLRTDLLRMNRRRIDKVMRTTAERGRVGGARTNLRWLREFVTFDPREHLPQVRVPVTAITGAKDLQAPPEDVATIGQHTSGPFTGHVVDDVNHILRTEPGAPSLRRYRTQVAQPLDARVVAHVVDFITATATVPRQSEPRPAVTNPDS